VLPFVVLPAVILAPSRLVRILVQVAVADEVMLLDDGAAQAGEVAFSLIGAGAVLAIGFAVADPVGGVGRFQNVPMGTLVGVEDCARSPGSVSRPRPPSSARPRATAAPSGSSGRGRCGGWRGPLRRPFRRYRSVFGNALPDRLQRLVPRGVQRCVDTDALGRTVLDGDEDRNLTVLKGQGGGHVGAPHRVYGRRFYRTVVAAWSARSSRSRQGLEAVLAQLRRLFERRGSSTR
jgi:hypothetical protein